MGKNIRKENKNMYIEEQKWVVNIGEKQIRILRNYKVNQVGIVQMAKA